MRPGNHRLLMITPIWPDPSGNGLARRAHMFVSALKQVSNLDVLVLPIFHSGKQNQNAPQYNDRLRYLPVPQASLADSQLALIKMMNNPAEQLAAFRNYGKPSVFGAISAAVLPECLALINGEAYRHVHVFRTYCAPLGLEIANRLQEKSKAAVTKSLDVDEDDGSVFHEIALSKLRKGQGYSAFWDQLEARSHEHLSRNVMADFDTVFVSSDVEKARLHHKYGVASICAPNAITGTLSRQKSLARGPLLFVGTMGYYPNQDAMDWFLKSCWPVLSRAEQRTMVIIGAGPKAVLERYNRIAGVRALGWVDNIGQHYREAFLFIVPLRIAGGTRIKLLEAAAHGVPIVSTAKGAEGLGMREKRDFWQADSATAFVSAIRSATVSRGERDRRLSNARTYVSRAHSFHRVTGQVSEIVHQMLN